MTALDGSDYVRTVFTWEAKHGTADDGGVRGAARIRGRGCERRGEPWPVRASADERAALAGSLGGQTAVFAAPDGTLRSVARLDGTLTGPSSASARAIVTSFLLDHAGAYGVTAADVGGLRVAASRSDGTVTHVVLQQRVGGLPVEGGDVVANLTADGRLLSVFGAPRAGVQAPSATARVSAAEALRAARDGGAPGRGERAQLVLAGDGAGRLAWRVTAAARGGAVDALVDAATGQVLQRRRLAHDAVRVDAKVFDQYPGAARGGTQRTVDITQYVTAPGQVKLFGPFVYVISDLNDDLTVQASEEVPPSSADDYLYTFQSFGSLPGMNCPAAPFGCSWNPGAASSWQSNRLQAGTQAFWYANRFHDHLSAAPISFTKAKGAFEGNDRVWVTVDTGASVVGGLPPSYDVNNAFMQVFPSGPPLLTLELFEPVTGNAWPAVNGADDASIVYHEYTHGMSGKLIVDSSGAEALDGAQANAMNEAWSDWFAMDDLVLDGYVQDTAANGEVVVAPYVDRGRREWRYQALDCPVGASATTCPGGTSTGPGGFTYGDLGHVFDVAEAHADGEIWAETLWDLRSPADHGPRRSRGRAPGRAAGDPGDGARAREPDVPRPAQRDRAGRRGLQRRRRPEPRVAGRSRPAGWAGTPRRRASTTPGRSRASRFRRRPARRRAPCAARCGPSSAARPQACRWCSEATPRASPTTCGRRPTRAVRSRSPASRSGRIRSWSPAGSPGSTPASRPA